MVVVKIEILRWDCKGSRFNYTRDYYARVKRRLAASVWECNRLLAINRGSERENIGEWAMLQENGQARSQQQHTTLLTQHEGRNMCDCTALSATLSAPVPLLQLFDVASVGSSTHNEKRARFKSEISYFRLALLSISLPMIHWRCSYARQNITIKTESLIHFISIVKELNSVNNI